MSTSKTGETYHHLPYLFLIFGKKPENSNAVPRFPNYFLTAAYSFIIPRRTGIIRSHTFSKNSHQNAPGPRDFPFRSTRVTMAMTWDGQIPGSSSVWASPTMVSVSSARYTRCST